VPRIAFAWELGGEFGHAMSCAGLAKTLHARGHRIALMFRELRQLAHHPETSAYDLFTAPGVAREGAGMALPSSLADILLGCGYADSSQLAHMLGEWLRLLRDWRPDLLVADYAPTALLAARVLGLRRVTLGIPFALPPPLIPLPPFRFDLPPPPERLAEVDARALLSVNAALAANGAAPLAALRDLFDTDEDFLCCFPELDSYGTRPTARYWGPRYRDDAGVSAHWPAGAPRRVLVYLKKSLPQLDALIELLARSPYAVIAFIPELEAARREQLRGPRRIVSDKPVRFAPLLGECDLFISQAGSAAPGTLMSGIPQMLFPQHYEQHLTALRIAQMGAGISLLPDVTPGQLAEPLRRLLDDARYKAAARNYAKRYPAYSPGEQQRRIVARIDELLAQPPRPGALPVGEPRPILAPTSDGREPRQ
jgi:UDP:flavonoid glycosyltransferase YjiC (YdhE family)